MLYDYAGGIVSNVEALVVETWRVASRIRSSGTRNYMGAVMEIDRLRREQGEFATEEEFQGYWRNYPIGPMRAVEEPGLEDDALG